MILNKKLWALVDPTESYIVWSWEAPLINENKKELMKEIRVYERGHKELVLEGCKIKQVYISIAEKQSK